jgi:hypothetical protein
MPKIGRQNARFFRGNEVPPPDKADEKRRAALNRRLLNRCALFDQNELHAAPEALRRILEQPLEAGELNRELQRYLSGFVDGEREKEYQRILLLFGANPLSPEELALYQSMQE